MTIAAVLAIFASTHDRGGDARGAPVLTRRSARGGIDDVVEFVRSAAPTAYRRARGRDTARRDDDLLAGSRRVADAWSSVTNSLQPGSRRGPATAMSPPRLTSTPAPVSAAMARAARSAHSAFAVAPKSNSTPPGMRTVERSRSTSTVCQPGTRCTDTVSGGPFAIQRVEVAVVAEHPHRRTDRRVDAPVGDPRARATRRPAPRGTAARRASSEPAFAFTRRQLGVVAKPTAREVDRVDLAAEQLARARAAHRRRSRGAPQSFRAPGT